jgi:hypothetical protein
MMGQAAILNEVTPRPPFAQELREELINKPTKKVKKIYESRGIDNWLQRFIDCLGWKQGK